MATTPQTDPWLDTEFGTVDFQHYAEDKLLEPDTETAMIQPDFGQVTAPAEVVTNVPAPEPEPIVVEVEPEGPEVIDLGDGSRIEIEKSSKGWKASLLTGTGGAENFYGKTKNELIQNIAVGKLNATKKIRELNKQVKFGTGKDSTPATRPVIAQPKTLSADEVFSIKTKLESNPDLALEEWFQAKTGLSVNQLVSLAQKGQRASQELDTEATNKSFLRDHPAYYPDENFENFTSLVALLAKNKLDKTLTKANKDDLYSRLQEEGHWTVQNLDEAFEDLSAAGLLLSWPQRQETRQEAPPAPPAPLPADPRIVSRVVQPRAGLGLRQSEATPVRPEAPKPPSVDDLNDLTAEQIKNLYHETLRLQRTQGRRS